MKDKLGNLKAIKTYGVQHDIVPTGRQMYKQGTKRVLIQLSLEVSK